MEWPSESVLKSLNNIRNLQADDVYPIVYQRLIIDAGVIFPADTAAAMQRLLTESDGKPIANIEKAMVQALKAEDFIWPELENCLTLCEKHSLEISCYQYLEAAKNADQALRRKCNLLYRYITASAYSLSSILRNQQVNLLNFRPYLVVPNEPSMAKLAKLIIYGGYDSIIQNGEITQIPPLFPGDYCYLNFELNRSSRAAKPKTETVAMTASIVNYYDLLGISITAEQTEIRKAMQRAAEKQAIDLDTLTACRNNLLDENARKSYNQQLFMAQPELLEAVALAAAEKAQLEQTKAAIEAEQQEIKAALAAMPPQKSSKIIKYGGSFLLACILLPMLGQCGSKKTPALDEWSAQVTCKDTVQSRLRAPASADFGDWQRTKNPDGTYTVTGNVDAQNGFGAMLRHSFICEVRDKGDGIAGVTIKKLESR